MTRHIVIAPEFSSLYLVGSIASCYTFAIHYSRTYTIWSTDFSTVIFLQLSSLTMHGAELLFALNRFL